MQAYQIFKIGNPIKGYNNLHISQRLLGCDLPHRWTKEKNWQHGFCINNTIQNILDVAYLQRIYPKCVQFHIFLQLSMDYQLSDNKFDYCANGAIG